ncbi:MAG: threonylcarbamoyl-AMP synthase [Clostridia bacterium]|nr:threonylcarbamoyl-AMP synthase [Clostridia bacterium]MBR0470196.1 threonylcarbamoyl-AMP synthase [Clostridia bacterium]
METKLLTTSEKDINTAGGIIADGGLVAFPTETVYGLGASAFDTGAAKKIYAAKGRPSDNPLIVHIADKLQLSDIAAEIPNEAKIVIDKFMPGPITVILKKKPSVPDTVTAGLQTVAIRFPSNETAQRLIKAAGVPIAAPSANLSGKPSPTSAAHVIADMAGRIDAIIDGGACDVGVESTIVDFTGDKPEILRPGGVTYDDLKAVGLDIIINKNILKSIGANEVPKSPGMKYKHYAPNAEVTVVEGEKDAVQKKIKELLKGVDGKTAGVLAMYGAEYDDAVILTAGESNREYAKNLFSALREFDNLGVEIVFAEFCEKDGYGLAVKNRLYKAAAQRVIHV